MDTPDENALKSGGMATFQIEDLTDTDQLKDNSVTGGFHFLPKFPRTFNLFSLFGRYTNVIPEETDEAAGGIYDQAHQSCSTIQPSTNHMSGDHMISKEVQKLGLTAETNPDIHKFEPYWVEVGPKFYRPESRRHSTGSRIKKKEPVKPSPVEEAEYFKPLSSDLENSQQSKDDLALVNDSNINRMADFHDDTGIDFSGISDIPRLGSTNSLLGLSNSSLNKRGKLFRQFDNMETDDNGVFIRGGLFGSRKGKQKSSSTSNLAMVAQEDKLMLENMHQQQFKDIATTKDAESVVQPFSGSSSLRRSSSTGALQRLHSIEHESFIDLTYEDNEEKKLDQKNPKSPENKKVDGSTPIKAMKDTFTNFGKQTVTWATTSKVKQTEKEKHFMSPTSF